jgi:hypothetical protein
VLVPHTNGIVDPVILRAVRAYDPDYVVSLPITFGHIEAISPGTIEAELTKLDTGGYEQEAMESLRAQIAEMPLNITQDEAARKSVVDICSTYRMALGADSDIADWHERITTLTPDEGGHGPFTPLHLIAREASPRFGARPELNTPLGLLLADLVGLVNEPTATIDTDYTFDEEALFIRSATRLTSDAQVSPSWSCFEEINSAEGKTAKAAWVDSQLELGWVTDSRHNDVLYVIGNKAEDFCLAFMWKRIYGQSLWIPDELWVEGKSRFATRHRQSILQSIVDLTRRSSGVNKLLLTSASGDSELIDNFRNEIFSTEPLVLMRKFNGEVDESSWLKSDNIRTVEGNTLRFPDVGRYFLGLQRQFQFSDTMPVIRDSEGGVTLAATPPAPVLDAPGLGQTRVSFHIDLDIPSVIMPQARAIPPTTLMRATENPMERYQAWVRNGRRGVSYESKRYDFVQSGILPQEGLARPRIRMPGMLTWARCKAEMTGLDLHVSDAGWPAHILAEMCGSRQALTEVFAGPLRPALLKFIPQPKGTSTTSLFKDKEGFVINGQVYLTLHGFESISGLSLLDTRTSVDRLLRYGILTRGILLRCSICRIFSFYSIDEIGQSNTCPRCGNSDQLAQERWQVPKDEPPWSYDLHPLGRNLVRDNGDVSLLLAAYLRNKVGNQYSDASEVVAIQSRKTIAEADLIAVAAGVLIVAEAKRNGELGRKAEEEKATIKKRLSLAEIFNADEIVIATTHSAWKERSLNAMKDAIDSYAWPAGLKPRLRVVTSLAQSGIGVEEYM